MGGLLSQPSVPIRLGCNGGLGNRLDVIATILLVSADGPEPEILWPINEHMPAHFRELFTGLPRGRVTEAPIDHTLDLELDELQRSVPRLFRDSEAYRAILRSIFASAVDSVAREVETFSARHFVPDPPVGVHIRRVEKSGMVSPFAQPSRYYEAVMRSCPRATRFFLCTDSRSAFEWMRTKFGARVFERPKVTGGRSDVAGVREGLVDMMLLSRCSYIIGTDKSTFAAVAGLVGGIPLCRVCTRPKSPKSWPHFSRVRWLWSYRHFVSEATYWRRWWKYESPRPNLLSRLRHVLELPRGWVRRQKRARR